MPLINTADLTLTPTTTDPEGQTWAVTHGEKKLGNVIKYPEREDWMAQPEDEDQTTVWGCTSQEDALTYLVQCHQDTQDMEATQTGTGWTVQNQGHRDDNYEAIRDSLNAEPWANGMRSHTVVLAEGDLTWNPASTKPERALRGPGQVTYHEYVDGSIHARQH